MALFDVTGKPNTGHALETAVLHQLKRLGAVVSYVHTRGGFEVDFCAALPDGQTWLVQVCLDLSSPDTFAREVRALQDAQADWPQARLILVAHTAPAVLSVPTGIELHRATTWLLEPSA
jgi:predicted AAA+ superfamily ATPase